MKYANNMRIKYCQNFKIHMFFIEFNRFKPNFKNMWIGHSHKRRDSTYKRDFLLTRLDHNFPKHEYLTK